MAPLPRSAEFYRGKTIFITGSTGFIGKVLLEKILRSYDVAAIYVLIRPMKGKSARERLNTQVLLRADSTCVMHDGGAELVASAGAQEPHLRSAPRGSPVLSSRVAPCASCNPPRCPTP